MEHLLDLRNINNNYIIMHGTEMRACNKMRNMQRMSNMEIGSELKWSSILISYLQVNCCPQAELMRLIYQHEPWLAEPHQTERERGGGGEKDNTI